MVMKAASHLHTAGAGRRKHRSIVARRTFPGFAAEKSMGDPALRPRKKGHGGLVRGMSLRSKSMEDLDRDRGGQKNATTRVPQDQLG